MFKYDPHKEASQYLEDLATLYWFSECLFTALELDLFSFLEKEGKTSIELAEKFSFEPVTLERYLSALCTMGLLTEYEGIYYNTLISSKYLVKGKKDYLGDFLLWRKYSASYWKDLKKNFRESKRITFSDDEMKKYFSFMNNASLEKGEEITKFFKDTFLSGEILGIGATSGAVVASFLKAFPDTKATFIDTQQMLSYTKEYMEKRNLTERVTICSMNILEKFSLKKNSYDLVVISNITDTFSKKEAFYILKKAVDFLNPNGFIIIHDFFFEHFTEKAALNDLNMLFYNFNGRVFSKKWVLEELRKNKLYTTDLVPLKTDTAVIIGAKKKELLEKLTIDPKKALIASIKALGFKSIKEIEIQDVKISDWPRMRCQYGCDYYGRPHCPPNTPTPEETRRILKDYRSAFLLEGEPPTGEFQKLVLKAEKEAFKAGFYKAFSFWAGPCSICVECSKTHCINNKACRPSMEGSGIDVFETVRSAGYTLKTLKEKGEYVKYFALLLLE